MVKDLDLRPMTEQIHQNGFRWNSTSNLTQRSREEEKTPIKRTKDIILEHLSAKRPRTSDPFESPNPRIKDFRLIGASNDAKDSYNCDPFFCRFCKVSALNLKELAEHLRGKRHQKVGNRDKECLTICFCRIQNRETFQKTFIAPNLVTLTVIC